MATMNFRQVKGVYEKELLSNGEYKHNLVDTITTDWCVSTYDGKDILTITCNGKSKTIKVEDNYKWLVLKIMKSKVLATGGAKGLFDFFCQRLQTECEYDFVYLENIFKTTKAIKNN